MHKRKGRKAYSKDTKRKVTGAGEPPITPLAPQKLGRIFKTITVSSFDEQEQEMRAYSASLSPVERMHHLQELISIAWAHVLNDPKKKLWDKIIHIDREG